MCRLILTACLIAVVPDGVRDAVNSARANANSASTRRAETGMPAAPNDGRQSREPRAPRG